MTMVTDAHAAVPIPEGVQPPRRAAALGRSDIHSQGKLRGTRAELIAEEQKRIETYTAQGDLLPRERSSNTSRRAGLIRPVDTPSAS